MILKPDIKLEPIEISSSGLVRVKTFKGRDLALIREGEIITLSTKVKNIGGNLKNYGPIVVYWYLDEVRGDFRIIAKQKYEIDNEIFLRTGDEMLVSLNMETVNLGLGALGVKGVIRRLKISISEENFENIPTKERPLFKEPLEAEIDVVIDSWAPELRIEVEKLSKSTLIEGDLISSKCNLINVGKAPIHCLLGNLKMEELATDERTVLKTHYPNFEFKEANFNIYQFNAGYSNEGLDCESISFSFSPIADIWVDSIRIKPKTGIKENVNCKLIKISYLGYPITSSGPIVDTETGILYLANPVLLEEGKDYIFEFVSVSGTLMTGEGEYSINNRVIIKTPLIKVDENTIFKMHPKIELLLLKTLPPQSKGTVEMLWDTTDSAGTKFLRWIFSIPSEEFDFFDSIPINIKQSKNRGFQLVCKNPAKLVGPTRIAEFQIKLVKDREIEILSVEIIPIKLKIRKNGVQIYLRELDEGSSKLLDQLNFELRDTNAKMFIAGISVPPNLTPGTILNFHVKATAFSRGQKYEKILKLHCMVISDFLEITDLEPNNISYEYLKDFEFLLTTDWRILSVVPGEPTPLTVIVENFGRRSDSIKITIFQTLPMGWAIRPHHLKAQIEPAERELITVHVDAPINTFIGEGGNLMIKAESKGDRTYKQIKKVSVRAVARETKWKLQNIEEI